MFTANQTNDQPMVDPAQIRPQSAPAKPVITVGATKLMSPERLAEVLGVSIPTLAVWRVKGEGPKFVKLGRRRIVYFEKDVEAWLSARVFDNTTEAMAAR